jgi:hypothetical protein
LCARANVERMLTSKWKAGSASLFMDQARGEWEAAVWFVKAEVKPLRQSRVVSPEAV